jgi:hypothetical protein
MAAVKPWPEARNVAVSAISATVGSCFAQGQLGGASLDRFPSQAVGIGVLA